MKRRILAALSVVVALGAIAWILASIDLKATLGVARRTGAAGTAVFLAVAIAPTIFQAVGWHVLLRARGWRIPFRATLSSMFMGLAGNYVTPSMYLGGEPIRIWTIGKRFGVPKRQVAATVFVHKFAEFAGFIVAMLAAVGVMLWRFRLSWKLQVGATAAAGALLAAFLALLLSFIFRWPLASGFVSFLSRILPARRAVKLRRLAREVEEDVAGTFRSQKAAFAVCLVFTGAPAALILAKPWFFFIFLGRKLSLPELSLIFVLTQIILAFQFTPGGLGIFEGGAIGAFALIGVGAPEAFAYAAIQRLADAVFVGWGVALAAHHGVMGFLRGEKPGASESQTPLET